MHHTQRGKSLNALGNSSLPKRKEMTFWHLTSSFFLSTKLLSFFSFIHIFANSLEEISILCCLMSQSLIKEIGILQTSLTFTKKN